MQQPPQNQPNLFQDGVICGAIGAGIAYLFGRNLFLWALLCTMIGPVFVLWAARIVAVVPMELPGKHSGSYEFGAFALCTAIAAAFDPFGT